MLCPDLPKANPKSRMAGKNSGLTAKGTQAQYKPNLDYTLDHTGGMIPIRQ